MRRLSTRGAARFPEPRSRKSIFRLQPRRAGSRDGLAGIFDADCGRRLQQPAAHVIEIEFLVELREQFPAAQRMSGVNAPVQVFVGKPDAARACPGRFGANLSALDDRDIPDAPPRQRERAAKPDHAAPTTTTSALRGSSEDTLSASRDSRGSVRNQTESGNRPS